MKRMKLLVVLNVFCLTECLLQNDARHDSCSGNYTTSDGIQCCLCPKGFHLVSDCTSPLTEPQCESCVSGSTYLDYPNSERKCELCSQCDNNENKVIENRCTPASNTKCRCQDSHYCDKEPCKVCYECRTCEFGVKVPCSHNSDAQCLDHLKPPEGLSLTHKIIIIIISLCISTLVPGIVIYLKWRKLLCFKSESPEHFFSEQSLALMEDPDLNPMLPKIAQILGCQVVLNVVRHTGILPEARIDNIRAGNQSNMDEQAYQLLKTWYDKHGIKGAYKNLSENLIAIDKRREAEEVHQIIINSKEEVKKEEV